MAKPNLASLEWERRRGVIGVEGPPVIIDFLDGTWIRWKTHLVLPAKGRKFEQEATDARRTLCLTPAFRLELLKPRECYRVHELDARALEDLSVEDAEELGKRWGFYGAEWVSWLVKNWDPNASELPPREPDECLPYMTPWLMEVTVLSSSSETDGQRQKVNLILNRGISIREAQKAAALATRILSSNFLLKGARPRMANTEMVALRKEFARLGIPRKGKRSQMVRKVYDAMRAQKRAISMGKIGDELRLWLEGQGQSVRRYHA